MKMVKEKKSAQLFKHVDQHLIEVIRLHYMGHAETKRGYCMISQSMTYSGEVSCQHNSILEKELRGTNCQFIYHQRYFHQGNW